ncbi:hypothetical protein [Streptomyces sp. NPDC001966]
MFAMAGVDLSTIDIRVHGDVTARGLHLISLDVGPDEPRVYVCTDPDPEDIGYTMRGHVTLDSGWGYVVVAMDGGMNMGTPALDTIPRPFPSWETGIRAVLDAFDRYSRNAHY